MKKLIGEKTLENKDNIVEYCKNCHGLKPCWCENKDYLEMWKFVYEALKKLKP